jgi:hypothetical protein
MISNLIASMRDTIKSETELYTMRLQQHINRYCSIIENTVVLTSKSECNIGNNYQDQIDSLKTAMDSIITDLYKYKSNSICSSDLDNEQAILPEPNWVVNKVQPDEIKEVHINLNDIKNDISLEINNAITDFKNIPIEAIIKNKNTPAPISSAATIATSITNDEMTSSSADTDEEYMINDIMDNKVENMYEEKYIEQKDNANDNIIEEKIKKEVEKEKITEMEVEVEEDDKEDKKDEEDEVENDEEDEVEELELEEIEWKGIKYYKDADGNVYEYLKNGDVGESIGTMSKKIAGKVLLYSSE